MIRFVFILLGVVLIPSMASGQVISNVRATFTGGKVTITYDLMGGNEKQTYNVSLYSSHDNYAQPVRSVSGDVGTNMGSGTARQILWDAQTDLDEYKGALTFRVSADPIPIAYSFTKPAQASSYRRGKSASITWEGGTQSENITIELLNNGAVVQQISNARNSGVQNWAIPKDMTKGKTYQLRLRATDGQAITSNMFSIKSKIPLALKIAPVLLVGGVIVAISGGGGGDEPTNNNNDLPVAPVAPN